MKCRTILVINIFVCLFTQSVSLHSACEQTVVISKEYQLAEIVDRFPHLQKGFAILQRERLFNTSFYDYMHARLIDCMNDEDDLASQDDFIKIFDQSIYDAEQLIIKHVIPKFFVGLQKIIDHNISFQDVQNPLFLYVLQYYNAFMNYAVKDYLTMHMIQLYGSLNKAVIHNNIQAVQFLIDAGIDVNVSGSLLYLASEYNRSVIAAMLINAGAVVDAYYSGKTPLYAAVLGNHKKIVQILLEYGADIHTQCFDTTPLLLARKMNRKEVLAMMHRD
ncbi:ankyrin repeat domain-containing protein [Candidatus Chromulinivorax destructor]|uniref:Uncharacterized protein n=1 Tax=Candidatus Chromulinivorax destructor TaxID=2066483 RepID=A0A345ZAG8_9BACT|nr:ankyrin repeat domain-containing protein [Candidatus Chromulinivorax destructor]AXK60285.1 hypothetical protein C0J27_00770 [Candidatus Chromulinivorax destructor]